MSIQKKIALILQNFIKVQKIVLFVPWIFSEVPRELSITVSLLNTGQGHLK